MLELFVISVQNGLPVFLALAILLSNRAYAPMERRLTDRLTAASIAVGTISALILAWLRLNTSMIDVPTFNAYVGPPTFLTMIAFLVAVWLFGGRDLHSLQQGWRHRFLTAVSLVTIITTAVFFGFTFFFSAGSIVIMGSTILETSSLLRLAGYVLGAFLVIAAAWFYVVSAARVPWYVRSTITTVVFAAIILPRAILLYQQFATRGYVPRSSLIFTIVLWIQRNEVITLITLAVLVAIPAIVAVWTAPHSTSTNPATQRSIKADQISRRRFLALSGAAATLFVVTLTVGKHIAEYVPELSAIEPSQADGKWITVSRELVSDGHLHRFSHITADNTEVRFIVIQKNQSAFGTGLDACQICGNAGYYESDGHVICKECDVMMNIQTIGFAGGCNPIPIGYELTEDSLKFSVEELESHASIFAS